MPEAIDIAIGFFGLLGWLFYLFSSEKWKKERETSKRIDKQKLKDLEVQHAKTPEIDRSGSLSDRARRL